MTQTTKGWSFTVGPDHKGPVTISIPKPKRKTILPGPDGVIWLDTKTGEVVGGEVIEHDD